MLEAIFFDLEMLKAIDKEEVIYYFTLLKSFLRTFIFFCCYILLVVQSFISLANDDIS